VRIKKTPFAGTRFQTAGHQGAAKDVAAKHENQAYRPGHHHRAHPHHHPVGVPRLQVRQQVRSGVVGLTDGPVPAPAREDHVEFCFALLVVVSSPALIILGGHQRELFLMSVLIAVGLVGK